MRTAVAMAALGLALGAQAPATAPTPTPPTLTLSQALARARANSGDFQAALAAEGAAQADRTIARAALLPSLSYNTSTIYTQGNRFIANNAVHEYASQANLHEGLDFSAQAGLARAAAGAALARAQAEIAARGLAVTVATGYYTLLAGGRKVAIAEQGLADARKYLAISQERERGGEVAHADVVKAQLQVEEEQRALQEARLAEEQAKLGLAVLLFPDFNTNFQLQDDLDQAPPLPAATAVEGLAGRGNPQLAAAQATAAQAAADVSVARAGLLPSLSLDYFYGIDAGQFAVRNALGQPNLASAATATVNIPVFNWGANRARLGQARLRQRAAQVQLGQARRQLLGDERGFYAEAAAARDELDSLARSRTLADESLRLTGLRYQDGEATILELVDAQTTAIAAGNAYADGEVRYRVALAQLQTLTGAF